MNSGDTPVKTGEGRREVAERSGRLTAVERRLLILIDGKKSVNDLGAYLRVGELDAALDQLVGLGLVTASGEVAPLLPPVGDGFVSSGPGELARPATDPEEFVRVRDETSQFVRDRLGEAGAPLCAAIDRCASPHELRKMLRGIEVFVAQRLDAETTWTFVRHFGALLL